jgi:hypothetical protein
MAATFELKRSGTQFMFNLRAENGQVILTSERYARKEGATGGIASVRENAPLDARCDRLTATDGNPYFVLKASNGQVIGTSERYSSSSARENGIAAASGRLLERRYSRGSRASAQRHANRACRCSAN